MYISMQTILFDAQLFRFVQFHSRTFFFLLLSSHKRFSIQNFLFHFTFWKFSFNINKIGVAYKSRKNMKSDQWLSNKDLHIKSAIACIYRHTHTRTHIYPLRHKMVFSSWNPFLSNESRLSWMSSHLDYALEIALICYVPGWNIGWNQMFGVSSVLLYFFFLSFSYNLNETDEISIIM